MSRTLALLLLVLAALDPRALAHEVRPAYLQIVQTSEDVLDVTWRTPARADNLRLALDVRLPASAERISEPLIRFAGGACIQTWTIRHPGALVNETIHIDGLAATMTDVLVRIERTNGATQVARLTPDDPSLLIEASPGSLRVASTYLFLGVEHILLGVDHLLFVLALVILVRGWRRLVETITAFTIAHSITLVLATLGVVHVPGPPVEAIIALSIVFVASEILRVRQGRPGLGARRPWIVAFCFGLLHGLGFAGALSDVGLPEHAIPLALVFFNLGVEVGQLFFVAGLLLGARLIALAWKRRPEWTSQVLPYAIGGVAMAWVVERIAGFA